MYKIKQIPEDFIVKEVAKLNFNNNGKYSCYLLKKKSHTTIDAIKKIADKLKIKTKYINFAGTKDKIALTEQHISIKNGPKIDLKLKDIELKFLGKGNERLNLGDLEANDFILTVRNLDKKINKPKIKNIPNYFDEQRFGIKKNNHIIGKHIIKKEFKKACQLIPEIKVKNNDFIGALRTINKRILRMYIHAYQSYLFNKTVKEYLKLKTKKNIKLPIIGFGTEINENQRYKRIKDSQYPLRGFSRLKSKILIKDKNINKIIEKIMKKEDISLQDFIIRQIPELTSEGNERNLFVNIKNFKIISYEKDELNKGKKKIKIKFTLKKGSYATNVIKHLFN